MFGGDTKLCPMRVSFRLEPTEVPDSPGKTCTTSGGGTTFGDTASEMTATDFGMDSEDEDGPASSGSPAASQGVTHSGGISLAKSLSSGKMEKETKAAAEEAPAGRSRKNSHRRSNSISHGGAGGSAFTGGIVAQSQRTQQKVIHSRGKTNPFDGEDDDEMQNLRDRCELLDARVEIAENDARTSQKALDRQKKVYEDQLRKMREQNPTAMQVASDSRRASNARVLVAD